MKVVTKKQKKKEGVVLPLYFGWQARIIIERVQNWREKVFGPFKSYWQYITVVFLMIGLAGAGIFFYNHYQTMAASYSFSQTDWSGGADTNATASHSLWQTGWDKYYSKDDLIAAGTEISLSALANEKNQSTTVDFDEGTLDMATTSGDKISLIKSLGYECLVGAECNSGFCVNGVCCDSACAGTCSSCAVNGYVGTCTFIFEGEQGAGCTDTCYACDGVGNCTTSDTRWGSGELSCDAGSGDDANRCYDGNCVTCSTGGGKMEVYTCGPGAETCPNTDAIARESDSKVCWRRGGDNVSCDTLCSSYGSTIQEHWNDTATCTVCQRWSALSCNLLADSHAPMTWSSKCRSRITYGNSWSLSVSGVLRFCICKF